MIAEELSQQESQLTSHPFGKFLARTCAISAWKHQKDEWKTIVTQTDKNLELFKDIIGEISVVDTDPDPTWVRIEKLCGSVFHIQIWIHTIKNLKIGGKKAGLTDKNLPS